MKKIITHINPDLDAVASVWLIKRFLPGWKDAEIGFVASKKDLVVDTDAEIIYVDVGLGKFDHHKSSHYSSATKLCWEYIQKQTVNTGFKEVEKKAIQELVDIETEIDNALDLSWPESKIGRYYFYFHSLVDGLRGCAETDSQIMEFGFRALESILLNLKSKIKAEAELKNGKEFESKWGKAIALTSSNKLVLYRGEIIGYMLVVKKDPRDGSVLIHCHPDSGADLTDAYERVRQLDPQSDWFLHASKLLLLNHASVNPNMRPTKLSLEEIIDILKSEWKSRNIFTLWEGVL